MCLLRLRGTLILLIVRSSGLLLIFDCFSCFSVAFRRFRLLLLCLLLSFLFSGSVLSCRLITFGFLLSSLLSRRLIAFSFFLRGIVTLFGLCILDSGGWFSLLGFRRCGFLFLLLCNGWLSAALASWRGLFLFLLGFGFRCSGRCLFSSIRLLARFLHLLLVVFAHFQTGGFEFLLHHLDQLFVLFFLIAGEKILLGTAHKIAT